MKFTSISFIVSDLFVYFKSLYTIRIKIFLCFLINFIKELSFIKMYILPNLEINVMIQNLISFFFFLLNIDFFQISSYLSKVFTSGTSDTWGQVIFVWGVPGTLHI